MDDGLITALGDGLEPLMLRTLQVDEAGMAGTRNLTRVVDEAEAVGALVRLLGDPAQLGSVESGGALRLVTREVGAAELETLHRFRTPGEADATLALRDGDPATAWHWYTTHNRVVGGAPETTSPTTAASSSPPRTSPATPNSVTPAPPTAPRA